MLVISCLQTCLTEWTQGDIPVVHPYYKNSFQALSPSEDPSCTWNMEDVDFLVPMLKRTIGEWPREIASFYDVRLTENYSHPAPEYRLMDRLGIVNISPVAIRGMSGLAYLEALAMAEDDLHASPNQGVLLCFSDICTPYSHEYRPHRGASFVLSTSEEKSDGITILDFVLDVSDDRWRRKLSECKDSYILGDISLWPNEHQMGSNRIKDTELPDTFFALERIRTKLRPAEVLVVLGSEEHKGYIQYRVG